MKTLLAIIILTSTAFAQLPDAPRPTPKSFWIVSGMYVGAVVADGVTTHQGIMNGGVEVGSPWLYGRHPSNARFYATSAVVATGRIVIARKLVKSNRRGLRYIGWGMMYYGIEEHSRAAFGNTRVDYGPKQSSIPVAIDPGWHGGPITGSFN